MVECHHAIDMGKGGKPFLREMRGNPLCHGR
jgi:hypothetical protein